MSEPDATPRRPPRPRRRAVAALLVGIALVVAVGSVFVLVQSRSPQAVAERYLSHLASGDASAAMELVVPAHPELADVRDDRLLTDDVLRAATERMSDVRVTQAGADSESASFDAYFTLAGERFRTRLDLVPQGDTWQVAAPLTVRFLVDAAEPAALAIAGAQIAPPRLGEVTWVTMYPAVYPVEVVGSEQYKTSVDRIVVGVDSSPEIQVIPAQ